MNFKIFNLLRARSLAFRSATKKTTRGSRMISGRPNQRQSGNSGPHLNHWRMLDSCGRAWMLSPLTMWNQTTQLLDRLNGIYAHFDLQNMEEPSLTPTAHDDPVTSISEANMRASKNMTPWKASSPNGILKTCADQQAGVFTNVLNTQLLQAGFTYTSAQEECGNLFQTLPTSPIGPQQTPSHWFFTQSWNIWTANMHTLEYSIDYSSAFNTISPLN